MTLRSLYPNIDAYDTGMLDVGDGHRIYYERCGKPGGKPALFVHGGPGGGIAPDHRRLFDPVQYDVLLFEQRGCGRSTPYAGLENNTIWHLVSDIERLRVLAGVDQWLVLGGSWGTTLSLAYAETYPERVSEMVLRGIYTCSKEERDWFYQFGVSEIFPDKWEAFVALIPIAERDDMMAAYYRRLTGGTSEEQLSAARAWSSFENCTNTLLPKPGTPEHDEDDHAAVAIARLETHYFANNAWLEPGQLIRGAHRLSNIPGTIIHGRYDMPCPLRYAYALHKAWPNADFRLVEGAGHAYSEPGILDELIRATDQYCGK